MPPLLRRFLLPALALLASVASSPAAASAASFPPAAPVPAQGASLIAADWRAAILGTSPGSATYGKIEPGASDTVKLVTTEHPPKVFNLQAVVLNREPVKKGDTLFIRFAARSLKAEAATGVTKLRVGFSKSSPDWDSSYTGEIGLASGWQRFDVPFTSQNDFAPGQARLVFTFGYQPQIVELADVQLLRYPASVSVASLPKTRRFADPVKPERLRSEVARIAAMRAALDAVADPSPAKGRILEVSSGQSIQDALDRAQPGDTVLVAAGTYDNGRGLSIQKSGRPDAWIKLKASPGARPKLINSGWSGIGMRGRIAYIEIDGFELEWLADPNSTDTVHASGVSMEYACHHIRVLNNVVHGFGTGGIVSLDCDYLHIEGNILYDNCKTSPYGSSAISLCRAFDFDDGTGYRHVIRRNVAYDNELTVPTQVSSGGNGRTMTDGNGLIVDVFNKSRARPEIPHGQDKNGPLVPYHGRTLVENNLFYDNGGRGVHVFRSSNVDVINNTTYMNQKSPDINGGEYTAGESSRVVFLNNIAYGRPEKRGNSQDGGTEVIWSHNLFYNVADCLAHDGIIEADPLFVAPGLHAAPDGFRLRADSPARGHGLVPPSARVDLTGQSRPARGPIDLGAF